MTSRFFSSRHIDTQKFSAILRERLILLSERKILISRFLGSDQEQDLTTGVNCMGFGRIHHFCLDKYPDWSDNPLPIVPAAAYLQTEQCNTMKAQVFQNAGCNWRCWYCFVDYKLLSANPKVARYFTAEELVDLYQQQEEPPLIIDLSGGQPELTPEWVLWTIEALTCRGLADKVFLWSDDNLSTRYFWHYLDARQRQYIANYPGYAKVACFKGYDPDSFSFNTQGSFNDYDEQFEILRDLLFEGLDLYAYVTFTAMPHLGVGLSIKRFVDKLQTIHHNLPLRTVPLKIELYTPNRRRMSSNTNQALAFQVEVHAAWREELERRFSSREREFPIAMVSLN